MDGRTLQLSRPIRRSQRHGQSGREKAAYNCDITYGTNNEFGFDYLRDNMVTDAENVQRNLHYAIVTSGFHPYRWSAHTTDNFRPAEESTAKYKQYSRLISQLEENTHYNIDEKLNLNLTDAGITKTEQLLGLDNIFTEAARRSTSHRTALRPILLQSGHRLYG